MRPNKKGFTLIELIVVIAILAILAVALIPLINNFIEKSRVSRIMTTASTLETAAVAFQADVASFPDDIDSTFDQSELTIDPEKANWDGPYLNRNTEGISPWNTEMLLTQEVMPTVGEDDGLEYVLVVDNDEDVPQASVDDLCLKVDGNQDLLSGKIQQDNPGEVFRFSIIADAFLDEAPAPPPPAN